MKRWLHTYWLLVLCLLISACLAGWYYEALKQQTINQIETTSSVYAARTESSINAIFRKTDVLATVVHMKNGNIDEETFNQVASIVYEEGKGIRGIQYMPGAIVTYSYPLEGNESVMGKNFFDIPERRDDVLLAINTRSIALSGPYYLIQGGLGVVARNPVFLTDANGQEYFWGFSAIVLDLPDAVEPAGLDRLTQTGYDYQLFCVNENDERLVIQGNADMDTSDAICSTIEVPHHEWTLAVKELNPWANLTKAVFVLIACILISLTVYRRHRLVRAEKEASLARERFFSDVSHDMRTPLNAVINFSVMGQANDLNPAQKDDYFKKIETSGSLLLELVNETLTLSKADSGTLNLKHEPTSLEEVANAVAAPIKVLAQQRRIDLNVDLSALRTLVVLADRVSLQKILLNLLSNAVRYTPAGGRVSLTVADDPAGKGIRFVIADDGIGIGADFLPHIYEPFTQEQRAGYGGGGTGLGLSIVYKLVKAMQGTIEVQSKKDAGTVFTVVLPLEQTDLPAGRSTQAVNLGNIIPEGTRVLVCEDNPLNREIACTLLERKAVATLTAENGQKGVDAFAQSKPYSIDAVLMDIRMPVMNGYDAARAIRALDRPDAATVPIVAMTADAFEDDVKRALDAGMNAHVSKPVDQATLTQTLANVLADIRRARNE